MVDRHYSLNLKPWSATTLYVYAHADLAQKYSLSLQKILSPVCAPRKKIIFPALLVELSQGHCLRLILIVINVSLDFSI
jgi:hypothetical protein